MSRWLSFVLFALPALFLTSDADASQACSLGNRMRPSYTALMDSRTPDNVKLVWDNVIDAMCEKDECDSLYVFSNPGVHATAGFVVSSGNSKVVFSPHFVARIRAQLGWGGAHSIFAHRVAHFLLASGKKPAWLDAAWNVEEQTDAMVGCALAKMDLHHKVHARSMKVLSAFPESDANWLRRLEILRAGFRQCGGGQLNAPDVANAPFAFECRTPSGRCSLALNLVRGASCQCGHGPTATDGQAF